AGRELPGLVVFLMDADLFAWLLSRVAGLTSFLALAISLVTGLALRTAVLDWLGSNRALRSLHEFTALLWIPLGSLHLLALLLDRTARVTPLDLVIPFRVPYGTLAIGLGTVALELLAVAVPALHRQVQLRVLEPADPPVLAEACSPVHRPPAGQEALPGAGEHRHLVRHDRARAGDGFGPQLTLEGAPLQPEAEQQ